MTWHYKQDFVSPEPVYARVKEELRSYFDAGLVDDLLFPLWTFDSLDRFRLSFYPIREAVLFIDCFEAKLPPDFKKVREARACFFAETGLFTTSGTFYAEITTRVDKEGGRCEEVTCDLKPCFESCGVYKTNTYQNHIFTVSHYLKPGNLTARNACDDACPNLRCESPDVFDIHDGKFATNFDKGTVYLKYYSKEFDSQNNVMIPDNYFFRNYLEKYLKFKIFEQLSNQVTDETFNQIHMKLQLAERAKDEAFVLAEQHSRAQTLEQKINSIGANRRRLKKFRIR